VICMELLENQYRLKQVSGNVISGELEGLLMKEVTNQ